MSQAGTKVYVNTNTIGERRVWLEMATRMPKLRGQRRR